jgi:hypothetical protein
VAKTLLGNLSWVTLSSVAQKNVPFHRKIYTYNRGFENKHSLNTGLVPWNAVSKKLRTNNQRRELKKRQLKMTIVDVETSCGSKYDMMERLLSLRDYCQLIAVLKLSPPRLWYRLDCHRTAGYQSPQCQERYSPKGCPWPWPPTKFGRLPRSCISPDVLDTIMIQRTYL